MSNNIQSITFNFAPTHTRGAEHHRHHRQHPQESDFQKALDLMQQMLKLLKQSGADGADDTGDVGDVGDAHNHNGNVGPDEMAKFIALLASLLGFKKPPGTTGEDDGDDDTPVKPGGGHGGGAPDAPPVKPGGTPDAPPVKPGGVPDAPPGGGKVPTGIGGISGPGKGMKGPADGKWDADIAASAKKYNLNPDVVKALMAKESQGNPNAVSSAGCVGLMQLNPATASELAGRKVSPEELKANPKLNIDLGCKYLAQLSQQKGGKLDDVLGSYNQGPNANWKSIPEAQDYVASIEKAVKEQKLPTWG